MFVCLDGVQLDEEPYHPPLGFKFPVTKMGGANRSVKANWFVDFPWLHYDPSDRVLWCMSARPSKDNVRIPWFWLSK